MLRPHTGAGRPLLTPTSNHLRRAAAAACGALACTLCALTPAPARAQEGADALASRALFDEARRLMSAGQFAAACPKLEESQRLRAGIGTQFNLAECYEKLGRLASAWSLYLRVAADTKALAQQDRERVARERARALEARVAYLVLQVPKPVPGLELALDGSALGAAAWGVPTPIDPGEHQLLARAPGFESWHATARIPDHSEHVSVQVPALQAIAAKPAQVAAPAQAATPSPVAPVASVASNTSDAGAEGSNRTLPYVIGGSGLGLIALSGMFGLRFLHENAAAKDVCSEDSDACPSAQIRQHATLLDSARGARSAGYFTLALGVVGVSISAIWLLGSDADDTAAARSSSSIALGSRISSDAALLDCSIHF